MPTIAKLRAEAVWGSAVGLGEGGRKLSGKDELSLLVRACAHPSDQTG